MKKIIFFICCLFSLSIFGSDYYVKCTPWSDASLSFSLEAEVELTGGNYIDAWVTTKIYDSGTQIHSLESIFSFGAFFIDQLRGKQVLIFELKPAGGGSYKYDFISIAANHPLPSGNSYLTYKGIQYQAECVSSN